MEPLSTFILIASLAGVPTTLRSDGNVKRSNSNHISTMIPTEHYLFVEGGIASGTVIGTQSYIEESTDTYFDSVYTEIEKYRALTPGWDGVGSVPPGSEHIERVISFINTIPTSLPLPKAMLSPEGNIGLYWSSDSSYADITFEDNSKIFLYTRDRMQNPAIEGFFEDVEETDIGEWSWPLFNLLLPMQMAA